jgi:hypothetical protein
MVFTDARPGAAAIISKQALSPLGRFFISGVLIAPGILHIHKILKQHDIDKIFSNFSRALTLRAHRLYGDIAPAS